MNLSIGIPAATEDDGKHPARKRIPTTSLRTGLGMTLVVGSRPTIILQITMLLFVKGEDLYRLIYFSGLLWYYLYSWHHI